MGIQNSLETLIETLIFSPSVSVSVMLAKCHFSQRRLNLKIVLLLLLAKKPECRATTCNIISFIVFKRSFDKSFVRIIHRVLFSSVLFFSKMT